MDGIITTHLVDDSGSLCRQFEAIVVNASFDTNLGVFVAFDTDYEELVYIAPNMHRYCAICMEWAFLVPGTDVYDVHMVVDETAKWTDIAKGVNFAVAMNQCEIWQATAIQQKAYIYVKLADLGTGWVTPDIPAEEGTDFGFQETEA